MTSLFELKTMAAAMPLLFAALLLVILVVSFRSRAVVFCQYLEAMTGIALRPSDVRRVYRERGREGVRELFLDLIIREDLKEGPIDPEATLSRRTKSQSLKVAESQRETFDQQPL
jgi:hypothetical protein